jgi:bacillithiol synthase
MNLINFQQLRNRDLVSALYADYLTSFDSIAKFYNGNFSSNDDWKEKFRSLQKNNYDRSLLCRILNEQNREYHSGIKSLANIDLLNNENTFAVVTGQQLGIFSGPLYTIYKAITAVKLTQKLTLEYPEFNFVPVFWLEGEDHDFEEINKVKFINAQNDFFNAEYLFEGKSLEKNIGAVGNIVIDETINQLFSLIETNLPKTEYTVPLLETLKGYYKPGTTILKSFAGFLNHFYEDSGLIFINSNHPDLKRLLVPLFTNEVTSNSAASQLVIQKGAELEEQYHAQLKAKSINLFMFHKGGRYSIEPSEHDVYLKNTRQRYLKEELLTTILTTPEYFSPNVVLRPLCQDSILPTVAYVGGPAEIAYFAQLKPVYEYFKVTMPIIYPRASITIVEEKIQKVLEKYSLELIEMFGETDAVLNKVSEQVSEVKVEELFNELQTRINEAIHEARFGIQQIDSTLNGAIDGIAGKIGQQLDVLKQKTQKAQQLKEEISLKQIRKASQYIFPNGNFQERELSLIQYLNKYGPDFIKWISNELVIDKFQHQIISI